MSWLLFRGELPSQFQTRMSSRNEAVRPGKSFHSHFASLIWAPGTRPDRHSVPTGDHSSWMWGVSSHETEGLQRVPV